jgi:hypothetical protein
VPPRSTVAASLPVRRFHHASCCSGVIWPIYSPGVGVFRRHKRSRFSNRAQELNEELCKLGWFYDLAFYSSDVFELRDRARAGNLDAINYFFMEYSQQHSQELEQRITTRYQHKIAPLRQAFAVATQRNYYVAVAVLLAQADGIAVEIDIFFVTYKFLLQNHL